ncbi:hypothetical protein Acr_15g0006810 [Actinidia rufa]|uniref:Retrotransposon gag domain-containing protein n=1 Tax=Actinidia rufa TaxID=165716 RepID=A0A7J0FTP2_9ERIC|nr:hypothetical protein Acr_15g0006810 [Actinidia rufa]
MQIDLAILTNSATMTPPRITKELVKGILHGAIIANPQALTLDAGKITLPNDHLSRHCSYVSTEQKFKDLDPQIEAINTGVNAPVTMDLLIRQTEPPFIERVIRAEVSSKFKFPSQLRVYEGKKDPMDHLNSYKNLMMRQGVLDEVMCKAFSTTLRGPMRVKEKNASHLFADHQKDGESLKDYIRQFNQVVLKVEDPNDNVIVMEMMKGLRPTPLFDSSSKNVLKTLSAHQVKADKYIAAKELAKKPSKEGEGKQITRGLWPQYKRLFQLKEQIDNLIKRGYLRKFLVDCPRLATPERGSTTGDIQTIHGGFVSGGLSMSSRKKHAREAKRRAKEEVYNLSSPTTEVSFFITFTNEDLRGLHIPHDNALVVSSTITNFNV